jgi:hypothetical protein
MTANPRPRPALRKAPNEGHPAAIDEPQGAANKATTTKPTTTKPTTTASSKAGPKKGLAKGSLGTGSTSDTLRGKGKKTKKSTLQDGDYVDATIKIPRLLRKRLRAAAKAADVTVDEYLIALLDSTLL